MIKVSILDDHELFRAGISELFRSQSKFDLVGNYESVADCLENLKADDPEILLLDISIGDDISFNAINDLLKVKEDLKIIILSMHKKEFYVSRAMESGINGFMNKDISSEEFFIGLKKVHKGDRFFSAEISEIILNNIYAISPNKKTGIKDLTEREKEVLDYILEGSSSHAISEKLNISKKTVDNHRANILKKFGFKSTTMLIRELMNTGQI